MSYDGAAGWYGNACVDSYAALGSLSWNVSRVVTFFFFFLWTLCHIYPDTNKFPIGTVCFRASETSIPS